MARTFVFSLNVGKDPFCLFSRQNHGSYGEPPNRLRQPLLIAVTESRSPNLHDLRHFNIFRKTHERHDIVECGFCAVLVLGLWAGKVHVPDGGVFLLPEGPQAVDLSVMEEEDGV